MAIEIWNPGFRSGTSFENFANTLTILAGLLIVVFFIRQAILGNIRTKLIVSFVLVAVVAAGSVATIIGISLRNNLTSSIGNNLASYSKSQAVQIAQVVNNELNQLNALSITKAVQDRAEAGTAKNTLTPAQIDQLDKQWQAADTANNSSDPLVSSILRDSLSAELLKFQAKFPENVEVFLTDKPGVSLATTDRTSDYLQSDETWWQTAYKDGQYIGQPEFDASTKTLAINVAVAVHASGSDRIVGVLRTTVNINSLGNVLGAGVFGKTGRTDIFLPDGQVVKLSSQAATTNELTVEKADFDLKAFSQGLIPYQNIPLNGVPSLASGALVSLLGNASPIINNLGWYVVVHQDQVEALQPVTTQTRNALYFSLLVVILSAIAAFVLAQVLAGPIVRLNSVAEKVAAGDLTVQANVTTNDEIGTLATTFNKMVAQLHELIDSLEQRVADRTKALATSADVSRRLSTILDQRQLVSEVVEQIKSAFGYYHAHMYLVDQASGDLVMAGGTGEAGKTLLERGHRIQRGRGLVGRAAETKQVVLVPDTSKDPDWLPNPLLPETKSEVAIPIQSGDQTLGVLDVQNNVPDSLSQQDSDMLQAIANQVAIAIQNIRQYEETQHTSAQLSEALDIARLANWEYDVEKDLFTFNDHFYSIFHTTAEREGGYQISSAQYAQHLVHPDDIPIVGAAIEKALASTDQHYSTELEHRVIYADGGIGYISVIIHIDRDDQGHILRYYGANQDITERKLAEEAMRTSESRLQTLIDNAPEAIVVVDLTSGKFAEPNENAVRLYGLLREELAKVGPAEMSPEMQPDGRHFERKSHGKN